MKRQLSHVNIFNLKLIGAMAGTMGVVLCPFVAGAESTDDLKSDLQKQKKSTKFIATGIKDHKDNSKSARLKRIVKTFEARNKNKNLIALKSAKDTNTNLSAKLQQLVDERNYAAEYILAGLKVSESSDEKLPASLRKLVSERNYAAENTLIALKSEKSDRPKLSLVQKIKETRNQITDSKEQLVALEPTLSQENLENIEIQPIASHSNLEIQPIASHSNLE
ncbi:MAG: hypothetical protein AAFW70_24700, partial [Cyanobacteria bacterium J06635_10]